MGGKQNIDLHQLPIGGSKRFYFFEECMKSVAMDTGPSCCHGELQGWHTCEATMIISQDAKFLMPNHCHQYRP